MATVVGSYADMIRKQRTAECKKAAKSGCAVASELLASLEAARGRLRYCRDAARDAQASTKNDPARRMRSMQHPAPLSFGWAGLAVTTARQ